MMIKDVIRRNLRYYRIKKGISQQDLADKIYISRSLVAYWESGKASISLDNVEKITEALDISIQDLFKVDLSEAEEMERNEQDLKIVRKLLLDRNIINNEFELSYDTFIKLMDFIDRNIDFIIDKKK